ncbi:MAG: DUF4174 domain-containing protein [Nitrosomonadales bacterium]|nr:DUF4174 domain-containing protein [Nitrosomonadales bacterium]
MAHHLLSFSLLMLASMCNSAQAADTAHNPLLSDLWNHRPLLITVPDDQHPMLSGVEHALRQASVQAEFQERNMVLYVLTDKTAHRDGRQLQPSETAAILDALKVKTPINPTAILIGLDGGIKYQSTEQVDLQTIFTLIDGMSMRQRQRN